MRAALVRADALMRSLGRPNREQVVTTRGDQLTTLQALDLANGQILADTLARGANNLLQAHPEMASARLIEEIYVRALCRPPTAEELATARAVVGSPVTPESLADHDAARKGTYWGTHDKTLANYAHVLEGLGAARQKLKAILDKAGVTS